MRSWRRLAFSGESTDLNGSYGHIEQIDALGRPQEDVETFDVAGGYVVMIQDKLLFESGKADLGPEGQAALREIANQIKATPHKQVFVRGHTDSDPVKKPETLERFPHGNIQLSAERAVAVAPEEERYLRVRDLYAAFERGQDDCWCLALMEMLTDPMLRQWVPAWVVEQFERANPFYREVLTVLQAEKIDKNRALLKRTKREMIRRHQCHLKKAARKKEKGEVSSSEEEEEGAGESETSGDGDADKEAKELAARLAGDGDDHWLSTREA